MRKAGLHGLGMISRVQVGYKSRIRCNPSSLSLGGVIVPGMDPRDCYFVLWVETKDGVSRRVACGEVLADWWEVARDSHPTQVILG